MTRTAILLLIAAQAAWAADCVPGTEYDKGWRVRTVRVHHPFRYLSWLRGSLAPAFQMADRLEGQPFRSAEVKAVTKALENSAKTAAVSQVGVLVSVTGVTNCTPDQQLDLVFTVVDVRVSPLAAFVLESRAQEQQAPEDATSQVSPKQWFRLQPSLGYNAADRLFAGGSLDLRRPRLRAEGFGSGRRRHIALSLDGSRSPETGRVAQQEWALAFRNSSQPAGDRRVGQGVLAASTAIAWRPTKHDWVYRLAASLEGGFAQSTYGRADLDARTLGGSSYGSFKTMAGVTRSVGRQAVAATYGLELGAAGRRVDVDWVKHLVAVTHDSWWPVASHRAFDLEIAASLGVLQVPGRVPVAQRFFGGNVAPAFLPLTQWDFRAAPLLRGIPSYRLARFQNGAGATSFRALNLTAAIPAWGKPLVPLEASQNPEIRRKIRGQLVSAERTLKASIGAKHPAFQALVTRVKTLLEPLEKLTARVAELPESSEVEACAEWLEEAADPLERLGRADSSPEAIWDAVSNLLTDNGGFQNYLAELSAVCAMPLKDPAVQTLVDQISVQAQPHRRDYEPIAELAGAEAASEIRPAARIVNTLMDDMNLAAVRPVVIFDAASIGGTARYAAGGGVRFTLVSTVSFTVGWAWNVNRKPGEGPGAFFFSTQFKDLFR